MSFRLLQLVKDGKVDVEGGKKSRARFYVSGATIYVDCCELEPQGINYLSVPQGITLPTC